MSRDWEGMSYLFAVVFVGMLRGGRRDFRSDADMEWYEMLLWGILMVGH